MREDEGGAKKWGGEERDERRGQRKGKNAWGKRAIWGRETEGSWAGRLVRGERRDKEMDNEIGGEGIERARRGEKERVERI